MRSGGAILCAILLLVAGVGTAAATNDITWDDTRAETPSVAPATTDPGEIATVEVTNTTDRNDNDEYANFDLSIEADTRLPAGNDDSDGEAESRLKVLIDGEPVYENLEVRSTSTLSGRIPIPASALPDADRSNLAVTVVLWEDDPVGNDVLDRYTITVPYEANEAGLQIVPSRTSTVVGSPIYLSATGGEPGYRLQVVDAPTDSDASVQSHTDTAVQFRPDVQGTYVVQVEDSAGTTRRTQVTVSARSSLIDRYAPVLNYDSEAEYRPTRYEAMVENAQLYDEDIISDDLVTANPSMFTLGSYDFEPVMDLEGSEADYPAYDDTYPPTVYASVHQNAQLRGASYTAITYWLFYVYDPKTEGIPGLLAHQSDLETVTVFVNESGPQWVAASQHKGGELREWEKAPKEGTHLQVYPALGAHSNYLTNTDRYGGSGLLGQLQHSSATSQSTTILSDTVYTDTTGDDRRFSPDGQHGTDYEIVPLTGNEVWADFNGGFGDGQESGQVPMQRARWSDVGGWAEALPSDEAQRDAAIGSLETQRQGDTLEVSATLENTGPKPETFHMLVYAKPSTASWDSAAVRYLGTEAVPLGTEESTRVRTTVSPAAATTGSWDVTAVVSIYDPTIADGEDLLTRADERDAYAVTQTSTTRQSTTRPPPTTTRPTRTTAPTRSSPRTSETAVGSPTPTLEGQTPTEQTRAAQSTATAEDGGSPGFTGIALLVAMALLTLRSRVH